jgi:hypothetical protein
VVRLATHTPDDEVTVQPLPDAPVATPGTSSGAALSSGAAPAPQAAPVMPAEIKLAISATPANASIFLDGAQLQNPFSGQLKADADMHILRVSAPGMQTQEKVVQLDSDKTLHVELLPAQARPVQGLGPAVRRPGGDTPRPRDREPPRTSEPPRQSGDDFDTRITPEAKPRTIYEEDPY